jgi:hypothetical protein
MISEAAIEMGRRMSVADEAFEAWRARAADSDILEVALSDKVRAKLRKRSREWIGPCPRCGGKDRFAVRPSKQVFNCRGAGGGNVISMVMHACAVNFLAACEIITGEPAPCAGTAITLETRRKAAEIQAAAVERARRREHDDNLYRARERKTVFDIWDNAHPLEGSSGAEYMALRGLRFPPTPPGRSERLKCVEAMPYHLERDTIVHRGPALVAPIVDSARKFRGLHFTYLDLAQPKGKLALQDPREAPGELLNAKKSRGSKQGNYIALIGPAEPAQLVLGEGAEKLIAVQMGLVASGRGLEQTAFWSAADLGNLGGKALETIVHPTRKNPKTGRPEKVAGAVPDLNAAAIGIPDSVIDLVLLGDTTSDPFTTRLALARASARYARPGRRVRVAWGPDGADFDDLLRAAKGDDVATKAALDRIAAIVDAATPLELPAISEPPIDLARERENRQRKKRKPAPTSKNKSNDPASGGAGGEPPRGGDPEGGEDGSDGPRALGYSVEALNKEYALVKVGSQAAIFQENPAARLVEHQVRMLGIDTFKTWFCNRFTEIRGRDGKIKRITWAHAWLTSRDRRQYQGIEFFPDAQNAPGSPHYLNLWSGFSVLPAPQPDRRKYKTFRDHPLQNVCSGDERLFSWVFGFFAHMAQRPRERLGIALVLRGKMGTGKTKVGEIIGSLWPRHYFLVDDPRYVTGQFNAHMASCLLLQADEAVWAGDKAAEGRLKGLITAPMQQIEAKGIDPIRLANHVRLVMTSNEEWVVPAGKDERRFAVLDVDARCAQNHGYFAEMDAEMAAGGLSHLLGDLLGFDLASIDLRNAPRTDALLEQKIRSLTSVDSWWFERLTTGSTSRHSIEWQREVPVEALFDDYVAVAEKIGIRRKRELIIFAFALRKLVPGLVRARRTAEIPDAHGSVIKRTWCYLLPPLAEARENFAEAVGQEVAWSTPSDENSEEINASLNDEAVV